MLVSPIASLDTDIVHFEFSGIAVTYLDALDELRRHTRIAVSCRGAAEQIEPLRDRSRAQALAAVFSKVDLIHCVSEDMRRTVEGLGAPPERILVNRPAVPVADFAGLRRTHRESGPLRVLSVGRLHWKKGLDDGLRAVAELRSKGVECTYRIVGDGPEREKLTFMIESLGLSDSAELLGTCSEAEVRQELQRTDVVLLPSLSEGISNVVLEAMAAGRAVITTDCGGMTEVVEDQVDGLVVGVGDIGAMSERLAMLADDPRLRQQLGERAAATADEQFDIARQVRVFLDAYRSITC
jgi:colanic acid/amylovoran biosynthesis glycosyltransferase